MLRGSQHAKREVRAQAGTMAAPLLNQPLHLLCPPPPPFCTHRLYGVVVAFDLSSLLQSITIIYHST